MKEKFTVEKMLEDYYDEVRPIFNMSNLDIRTAIKKARELRENPEKYFEWGREYLRGVKDPLDRSLLYDILDQIFLQQNSLYFSVKLDVGSEEELLTSYKNPGHMKEDAITDVFDDIKDCVIELKNKNGEHIPFIIKVSTTMFKADFGNYTNQKVLSVSILHTQKFKGDRVLACFYILKDAYPRLLLSLAHYPHKCMETGMCKHTILKLEDDSYALYDVDGNGCSSMNVDVCNMTKRKSEYGFCPMMEYRPYVLLDIVAYVWDMYLHRNSVERKNSKRRNNYHTSEVKTTIKENYDFKYVSLHDAYHYERKAYQGGHHASPVEHPRATHMRYYRNDDGSIRKAVQVKGSIVNQGHKGKAVYSINTIKPKGKKR